MSNRKPDVEPEISPPKKGKDFEVETSSTAKSIDPLKPPTAFGRHAPSDAPPKREGGKSKR
jgi:hypothetical protein